MKKKIESDKDFLKVLFDELSLKMFISMKAYLLGSWSKNKLEEEIEQDFNEARELLIQEIERLNEKKD